MLNEVSADTGNHHHQHRDRQGAKHRKAKGTRERTQSGSVRRQLMGLPHEHLQGQRQRGCYIIAEHHHQESRSHHDEPGIDFLALRHITLFQRVIELLLGRFFCFFMFFWGIGHRALLRAATPGRASTPGRNNRCTRS